ncbi:hypothetical protein [Dactylosporangium sp. NPDC051484]|uniref:hypothetical protein n=1 Tax=Dactylosporangium sp. NPDC051484 TaxID=3154942 RepID=UPI00344B06E5
MHGLASAGGVGKVMAERIADGTPEYEVSTMEVRRFGGHAASRRWAGAAPLRGLAGASRRAGTPVRVNASGPCTTRRTSSSRSAGTRWRALPQDSANFATSASNSVRGSSSDAPDSGRHGAGSRT